MAYGTFPLVKLQHPALATSEGSMVQSSITHGVRTMSKKKDVFKEIEELRKSADKPSFIGTALTIAFVGTVIFLTLAIYFHD